MFFLSEIVLKSKWLILFFDFSCEVMMCYCSAHSKIIEKNSAKLFQSQEDYIRLKWKEVERSMTDFYSETRWKRELLSLIMCCPTADRSMSSSLSASQLHTVNMRDPLNRVLGESLLSSHHLWIHDVHVHTNQRAMKVSWLLRSADMPKH